VWTQDRVARWSIPTVLTVAQKIDAAGKPMGASWWPGYFVTTRTPLISTLANDFGFRAAPRLPPQERRRIGIVTHDEVVGMMDQHVPPLFVRGKLVSVAGGGLPAHEGLSAGRFVPEREHLRHALEVCGFAAGRRPTS